MVYSSSMIWAEYKNGSSLYFLIRQLIFFMAGLALYFFIIKLDSLFYQKYRNIILLIAIILLIVVFDTRNWDSKRWS